MKQSYTEIVKSIVSRNTLMHYLDEDIKSFLYRIGARVMDLNEYLERFPRESFPILSDAFYSSKNDVIAIVAQFNHPNFLVLRELIRWTAAKSRMNREYLGSVDDAAAYLGMFKLCEHFGIADDSANTFMCEHLSLLKNVDMIKAMAISDKAVNWLIRLEKTITAV